MKADRQAAMQEIDAAAEAAVWKSQQEAKHKAALAYKDLKVPIALLSQVVCHPLCHSGGPQFPKPQLFNAIESHTVYFFCFFNNTMSVESLY